MSWIVDHGIEILFVFLAIMTGAAMYFFRVSVDLERDLHVANQLKQAHQDLSVDACNTLDRLRRENERSGRESRNFEAMADNRAKRIERLENHCQAARIRLRDMCSRPSLMMDILDDLERQFKPNSNE